MNSSSGKLKKKKEKQLKEYYKSEENNGSVSISTRRLFKYLQRFALRKSRKQQK